MSTVLELVAAGTLVNLFEFIDLEEDEQPSRLIVAYPRAVTWLTDILPTFVPGDFQDGDLLPWEQADNLFHQFVVGRNDFEMAPHVMIPEGDGIWELRTPDLRFFGWFPQPACFILSACDSKERCVQINGLASGYRNQAIRDRDTLDLNAPKFVSGRLLTDVL